MKLYEVKVPLIENGFILSLLIAAPSGKDAIDDAARQLAGTSLNAIPRYDWSKSDFTVLQVKSITTTDAA